MAEIHIQRKGPGAWPWILGIVGAVVLVWIVLGMNGNEPDAVNTSAPASAPPPPASPDVAPTSGSGAAPPADVAAFLTFTEAPAGSPVGPSHEYAADGIRRLSRALNAIIEEQTVGGTDVRDQFAKFQAAADRIQSDPEGMRHADRVRAVFTSAAELMTALQRDRWPEAKDLQEQIAEVRSAAERVEANRPLLDQTTAIKTFFDRAADAIRTMAMK